MRLFVASASNFNVEVPEVVDAVVFEIVNALPPEFKPLMVTLSAPFKSIIGNPAVVAAEIVQDPPEGVIDNVAHVPAPIAIVLVPSVVLPEISILMLAAACDVPIAVIAAPNVV